MPGDEADGCEPDVSPFEIATQSWQTFDMVYKQTKDAAVAGRARPRGDPGRALRAQEHDRPELEDHAAARPSTAPNTQAQIDQLITQLYEYETPEGGWPYPFDKKAKTADFISYNAVLAAGHGRPPPGDRRALRPSP